MTDRELLELAAKAAGIELCWFEVQEGDKDCLPGWYCTNITRGSVWNPLTDDGDALRLAVKLRVWLTEFSDTVVQSCAVGWRDGTAQYSLWEPAGSDPYAATRRAIVRAAAEIGKGLKMVRPCSLD